MARHPHFPALTFSFMLLLPWAAALRAQSPSDLVIMAKARARYEQGPVPGSIACDAAIDWDKFFADMGVPMTDQVQERIEKLKKIKIAFTTSGPTQTDTTVTGLDPSMQNMSEGLRQQLSGFFQMYWSWSYGHLLGKPGDKFEIEPKDNGYTVSTSTESFNVNIRMDQQYLITSFGVEIPKMKAEVIPTFEDGPEGLLRMRSMTETMDLGTSKLNVAMSLDYQKVAAYEIPQHVTISVPGSFSFQYTFNACKVTPPAAHN